MKTRMNLLGLGTCLALSTVSQARDVSCDNIRDWLDAKTSVTALQGRQLREIEEARKAEWAARTRSAKQVVESYFKGAGSSVDLGTCLEGQPDRQNFLNTLQSEFFSESIGKFRAARSPIIQRMIEAYDRQLGPRGAALFRMTGHLPGESSPTHEKGGFHRGSGSIFMDLSRIDSNEWLLVFSHELLHSLDPLLFEAARAYSRPELLSRLGEFAKTLSDPSDLSDADRGALDQWIEAGLGRGLWAEYRAWTMTFAIYEDGLAEGLWQKIDWAERVFSERRTAESLARFCYRYLDARAQSPAEGIFSRPLIQRALERVRASYRNAEPPALGVLGKILTD